MTSSAVSVSAYINPYRMSMGSKRSRRYQRVGLSFTASFWSVLRIYIELAQLIRQLGRRKALILLPIVKTFDYLIDKIAAEHHPAVADGQQAFGIALGRVVDEHDRIVQ